MNHRPTPDRLSMPWQFLEGLSPEELRKARKVIDEALANLRKITYKVEFCINFDPLKAPEGWAETLENPEDFGEWFLNSSIFLELESEIHRAFNIPKENIYGVDVTRVENAAP